MVDGKHGARILGCRVWEGSRADSGIYLDICHVHVLGRPSRKLLVKWSLDSRSNGSDPFTCNMGGGLSGQGIKCGKYQVFPVGSSP